MITNEEIARVLRPYDPFIKASDVGFLYKVFMGDKHGVAAVKSRRKTDVAKVLSNYISNHISEICDDKSDLYKLLDMICGSFVLAELRNRFIAGEKLLVAVNRGRVDITIDHSSLDEVV